ncbi:MAG: cob(I)yrinic acid a,c-diamide adenosyltransferase [Lentimicrobiaceae bacterium]|jgi:cob(I)alamin adenosyltransferase|nr:cob(I)yrinic acid a,c-diamide adenosyltransferase [Lentimicrobiaceae bacterium]MDD4599081.1 cob(I)yrinic acid a,c-diamide adenosyltransferase [Lentimicrobiaceae bacterium]MDY0026808.1 cob(I)yrinic acid a,c-diamide adenosyltransferase [Lentimicrobium sp.]HAH59818.1 cob(I)yrinic acid a,c-diamide adenosyltransferase [Bacteroidales bacterium]
MKGYIHLYTGNGKGKTTAAFGLALRAAGAGKRVFIAQFVKGMHYAEIDAIKRLPEIELKQYGLDCFIVNEPTQHDIEAARKGLKEISLIIAENKTDLLILDEICIALHYHLFDIEEVVALLKNKPQEMEIVMTGRYAPPELYEMADLVTEMTEIKHYYNQGVEARKGIEF